MGGTVGGGNRSGCQMDGPTTVRGEGTGGVERARGGGMTHREHAPRAAQDCARSTSTPSPRGSAAMVSFAADVEPPRRRPHAGNTDVERARPAWRRPANSSRCGGRDARAAMRGW